jgi:hypothetical protein
MEYLLIQVLCPKTLPTLGRLLISDLSRARQFSVEHRLLHNSVVENFSSFALKDLSIAAAPLLSRHWRELSILTNSEQVVNVSGTNLFH